MAKKTKAELFAEQEREEAQLNAQFAEEVNAHMLRAVVLASQLEKASLEAGWGELSLNCPTFKMSEDGTETFLLVVSASHQYSREVYPVNLVFTTDLSSSQARQEFDNAMWAMNNLKESFEADAAEAARARNAKAAALSKLTPEDRKALGLL